MSAERDRLVKEMAQAIGMTLNEDEADVWDWDHTPEYLAAADAALRVIEAPPTTNYLVIKPCTCQHNGYGKHTEGCALA